MASDNDQTAKMVGFAIGFAVIGGILYAILLIIKWIIILSAIGFGIYVLFKIEQNHQLISNGVAGFCGWARGLFTGPSGPSSGTASGSGSHSGSGSSTGQTRSHLGGQAHTNSSDTPEHEEGSVAWAHAVLGVPTDANIERDEMIKMIRKAYHEQISKYHPDKAPKIKELQDAATQITRRLNQAYEILKKHYGFS